MKAWIVYNKDDDEEWSFVLAETRDKAKYNGGFVKESDSQKRTRLLEQCPELTDGWLRRAVKIEVLEKYAQSK